jgi:hypothetical protein
MPYFTLGQTDGSPESCSYIGIDAKDASGQKTLEALGCKVVSTDGVTAKFCCPKTAAEFLPPDIRATVTKIGQGLFRIPSDMLTRVQQSISAQQVQQGQLVATDPSVNPAAPPPPVDVIPSNVVVTEQTFPGQTLGSRILSAAQAHPILSFGGAALAVYLGVKWFGKPRRPTVARSATSSLGTGIGVSSEEAAIMRNPARLDPNHRLTWVGGRHFEVQAKKNKGWKKIGTVEKVGEGDFVARVNSRKRGQMKVSWEGPYNAARFVVANY